LVSAPEFLREGPEQAPSQGGNWVHCTHYKFGWTN